MILRSLNADGLARFKEFLLAIKTEPGLAIPVGLLERHEYTDGVDVAINVEDKPFRDKLEIGRYLVTLLERLPVSALFSNSGLWAWLTLFYFDQLCPKDGHGRRRRLSLEKYFPSTTDFRVGFDKHLLFFPWKMYKLHGDAARHLLLGSVAGDS